ncbi:hypothetical protein [Hyphomicrobium sp.]|uniref:hypothetical protein n=1 Tax=Hyphomicrobium sp. TaxID=82 RepID=UPI0025BF9CD2|nr:hypothetical protein [Hyphomicrobium sp.]MCC7253664.1 hypothetical protein [Hyphomicrobium sp.]
MRMMRFRELAGCVALVAAMALAWPSTPAAAAAKQFTFSATANERLARKLNIPIYFTVPSSTWAPLAGPFNTTDILLDFKHPEALKTGSDAGLRLVVTPRSGMAARLAKSGIFETGDLLLTFRAEWGGAGAYPNVQMGISHTGLAYIKDGKLRNLDNPLNEEYLGRGMSADLTSEHYRTLNFIHVIRPRGLTDAERANILAWATRLNSSAKRVYPSQIKFNDDYNAPKYKSGRPVEFVKHLGQIALGQNPAGTLDLYCSEFAWSLLALRGCDPTKTGEQFKGSRVPSCVKAPMKPLDAAGNSITSTGRSASVGLADGPLTVIDGLKIPVADRKALLESVFVENPAGLKKMSEGHRKVAQDMQPKFETLKDYDLGVSGGNAIQRLRARLIRSAFNIAVPDNYSPTSYLLNTLLPPDNVNRTMDYVATIVIE